MKSCEIFLLTKPPCSIRTKICLGLIRSLENSILYLGGDGVYNLIEAESLKPLTKNRIFACKEDMQARAVSAGDAAVVPEDFYRHLVEKMMMGQSKIYSF